MENYVVMPKADYEDILDATREKTGTTGLMVSSEVGTKIRSISSGGGGSFEDLSTELAAQEALLSSLGGALGALAPTIVISFGQVYWGESGEEYISASMSGSYSIDGGESISFDSVSSIEIPFVPIGSIIKVTTDRGSSWTNESGCTVDFDYDDWAYTITPTAEGASVMLYDSN